MILLPDGGVIDVRKVVDVAGKSRDKSAANWS